MRFREPRTPTRPEHGARATAHHPADALDRGDDAVRRVAVLQARSEQYVADIFDQLRDVSVAARANKPIGDKMIMNAAFLVSRDKETAFDAKVKEVGALYDKLNFRYTGPWPPYNFVNIRLKLERARESQ